MTPWFRMWSEVVDDPKVQLLDCCRFKLWVNCLCLCNGNKPRGVLPAYKVVAFKLKLDIEEVKIGVGELVYEGLFEVQLDGSILAHNWAKRNPESKASNERVKRHRDQKSALGLTRVAKYSPAEIVARDRYLCVFCANPGKLVATRLLPLNLSGTDDDDNLAACCKSCSNRKGSRSPEAAGMQILSPEARIRYARYLSGGRPVTPVTGMSRVTGEPETDSGDRRQNTETVTRYSGVTGRVTGVSDDTPLESDSILTNVSMSAADAHAPGSQSGAGLGFRHLLLSWGYTSERIECAYKVSLIRPEAPRADSPRLAKYVKAIIDHTGEALLAARATSAMEKPPADLSDGTSSMRARRLAIEGHRQ